MPGGRASHQKYRAALDALSAKRGRRSSTWSRSSRPQTVSPTRTTSTCSAERRSARCCAPPSPRQQGERQPGVRPGQRRPWRRSSSPHTTGRSSSPSSSTCSRPRPRTERSSRWWSSTTARGPRCGRCCAARRPPRPRARAAPRGEPRPGCRAELRRLPREATSSRSPMTIACPPRRGWRRFSAVRRGRRVVQGRTGRPRAATAPARGAVGVGHRADAAVRDVQHRLPARPLPRGRRLRRGQPADPSLRAAAPSARTHCSARVSSMPAGAPCSPRGGRAPPLAPRRVPRWAARASPAARLPRTGPPERRARRGVALRRLPVHRHRAVRLRRRRHRRRRATRKPGSARRRPVGRPALAGEHGPARAAIRPCAWPSSASPTSSASPRCSRAAPLPPPDPLVRKALAERHQVEGDAGDAGVWRGRRR